MSDSRRSSAHHVDRKPVALAALVALAAVLQVGAAVGLAFVAGFDDVRHVLARVEWPWLVASAATLAVSFVGYYFTYRGIYRVDDGPGLSRPQLRAVVIAGFGGFLAHGGAALDKYALEGAGADERDASVRVAALGGLEHGIMAIGGCGAAIAVLVLGLHKPPMDFTLPWAILPLPGFAIAFWAGGRYSDRFRDRPGWRGKVGVFLDCIVLVRTMFAQPVRYGPALAGMALFWVADAFSAWAALAAFGARMNAAAFFVGYATGMAFTRRTGPLGGAGFLALFLPLTLWYSGISLATAVVGVFAYRVLSLWLPMPFAFASLPRLRRIGEEQVPYAEGIGETPHEPALGRSAKP